MKRFPSLQCASAIKIVRPLESAVETQPQLHPALLRLSAIISQYFMRGGVELLMISPRSKGGFLRQHPTGNENLATPSDRFVLPDPRSARAVQHGVRLALLHFL